MTTVYRRFNDRAFFLCLLFSLFFPAESFAQIKIEPVFSNPGEGKDIQVRLESMIQNADKGSEVKGTVYKATLKSFANAWIQSPGEVQLLMDNSLNDHLYRGFRKQINKLDRKKRYTCKKGACIGDKNMHAKLYLFEATGELRNAVVFTSWNPRAGHNQKYNDMIVISGSEALYQGTKQYWTDLRQENKTLDYASSPNGHIIIPGPPRVEVYFYPGTKDLNLERVAEVDCRKGGSIHTAQSEIKGKRGRQFIRHLENAAKKRGCAVHVIARSKASSNQFTKRLRKLHNSGVLKVTFTNNVHSKETLIDGTMTIDGKKRRTQLVFTGSLNMKLRSLKNDEVQVNVEDAETYASYLANFDKIERWLNGIPQDSDKLQEATTSQ